MLRATWQTGTGSGSSHAKSAGDAYGVLETKSKPAVRRFFYVCSFLHISPLFVKIMGISRNQSEQEVVYGKKS